MFPALPLPPTLVPQVTISNSKFSTNRTDDGATSVTLAYLNDVGGARLTRNQFMNAQVSNARTPCKAGVLPQVL